MVEVSTKVDISEVVESERTMVEVDPGKVVESNVDVAGKAVAVNVAIELGDCVSDCVDIETEPFVDNVSIVDGTVEVVVKTVLTGIDVLDGCDSVSVDLETDSVEEDNIIVDDVSEVDDPVKSVDNTEDDVVDISDETADAVEISVVMPFSVEVTIMVD